MKTLLSLLCLLPALAFAQKVEYPGGVNSNQVYTIIQNIGINGTAVSNEVKALTVANFYTNTTPHYAEVHAAISMTGVGGYARAAVTNTAANSRFFVYDVPSLSASAITNTLVFMVPPSNHYKISGITATVNDGAQSIIYLATNSAASGGGSGDVTQSGLAAGSYPIKETALTGAFGFSSTNTFFAVNTNAITIVSNATGYATITLSGAGATARSAQGTYYRTANQYVYTNSSTKALWFNVNDFSLSIVVTNTAHPDAGGDFCDTALFNSGSAFVTVIEDLVWNDTDCTQNPLTVTSSSTLNYVAEHAKFLGEFSGDGSALLNVPTPSYAITNNRQSSAGSIYLTNKLNTASLEQTTENYQINLNYRPGINGETNYILINSNGISMAPSTTYDRGISWNGTTGAGYIRFSDNGSMLIRAQNFAVESPADYTTIRLTDDHRLDGIVKLSGQSIGGLIFNSNNYSGLLAFQVPQTNMTGSYQYGYSGIRGKNAYGAEVYNSGGESYLQSELWFYTLCPQDFSQANGGFRSVGDDHWFMIGVTNSAMVKGLTVVSNAISQWPTAPRTRGDSMFVNSNGVVFVLTSGLGLTWTATNKIAP